MKAFLVKTQISHLTAIQTKFHTSRHSKYVGGGAAGRGAACGGSRRGAVKAAALRGTLALLTKIPFIPLFIQPPRKVSKEAKMDEKFEPVQLMMVTVIQPYLYKTEKTTMRNSIVFGRFKQFFFQLCSNEYQCINNADSVFPRNSASFNRSWHICIHNSQNNQIIFDYFQTNAAI